MLILSAVHSYPKKITSSDKAYFYFAFASNMSKIASGTESLRAEHRGNDPRNWPIYFQCPCRHIRHDLYMIHKQSVDKEQSKSTRGHRTSEKKKFSSLSFPFRIPNNIDTLLFIFKALQKGGVPLSYLTFAEAKVELRQGTSPFLPERRCSSRTFRYGYLVTT